MRTRLAVIGDVHGNLLSLRRLLEVALERKSDGVLLVGDLAPFVPADSMADSERRAAIQQVLDETRLAELPYLWVPGNHDLPGLNLPRNVDRRLDLLCGLRVVGLGGAGPGRFGFPYEWSEEEIEDLDLPKGDVILSHTPPLNTALDRTAAGQHVGSRAVRARALAHSGVLVCGHIHEAAGVDRLRRCLCLNAGAVGGVFASHVIGWIDRREGSTEVTLENLEKGLRVSLESDLLGAG